MFCVGVLSQSRTKRENYMVNVRDFVSKQKLTTNELHCYVGQTSVLANQLVQKLYACTVAQVPSTVVQSLAFIDYVSCSPRILLFGRWIQSLGRNGKELGFIIREWSLDKMMSNWTTDDDLNGELADDNIKGLRKKFKVVRPNCTACLVTNESAVRGEVNTGERKIN